MKPSTGLDQDAAQSAGAGLRATRLTLWDEARRLVL